MRYVLWLDQCTTDRAERVGGKARGLGSLLERGFPVPPGFVVTTEAYRRCVAAAGIEAQIARLLDGVASSNNGRQASEPISALFQDSILDEEVAEEIAAAYQQLGGSDDLAVAVRSSATAEDLAEASFAGQQDTYLWIRGLDAVKSHVVRCWASLFTPRAIGYRSHFDVPLENLAMGVVVQRMVPAEAAGVMMTLEPITGDRSQIYIESAFGLGEIVVRGEVTPDRFAVDKASLTLRSEEVATKERAYRFDQERGEVRLLDVPLTEQDNRSLSADEVVELAELGLRVEEAFGAPMDVEWAIATDSSGAREMSLLQARPETVWSRKEAAEPREAIGDRQDTWDPLHSVSEPDLHWTTTNLGEAMPGVLTPLGWTLWAAGERGAREPAYRMGVLTRKERAVPKPVEERFIRIFYGRPACQVEFMAILGDRLPGTTGPEAVRSVFGSVPDSIQFSPTKRRYPIIAWRFLATFITLPSRVRRLTREQDEWYRESQARIPDMGWTDALATFRLAVRRFSDAVVVQGTALFSTVQPLYDALGRLVERTGVGDVSTLTAFSGGAEMAVVSDIWKASRGELELEQVVRNHGFHGPAEGEISSRVWREDDSPLRKMVEQYASRDDSHDPELREGQRRRERREIERELLDAVPRLQRPAVRLLLKLARERIPLRGVAKRSFLQAYDVARASARRMGEHLFAAGELDDADDVFYLTEAELTGKLPREARKLVARRRERRQQYMKVTIPGEWKGMPQALPADGPDPGLESEAEVVRGVGVSGGVVEGTARVVMSPDFAGVEPDEILVAPTTDPSWSSIMFVSSALVVDIGGALSHAAVVARELEIPCVVNTGTGSRVLRTGDRLRVDGTTGIVEILERESTKEVVKDAATA